MSVLWFDGLLTQVRDAGVYFLPEDDLDELREAAAINEFRCAEVDLADITDKAALLARVTRDLHLPDWAARNFDALADALGELRTHDTRGLVVVLENSATLRRAATADAKTLAEVLQAASSEWAERGAPLWAFFAITEAEFDALE